MKWIVDCQPGIDDAQALLLTSSLLHKDEDELVAVTVCCSAPQVSSTRRSLCQKSIRLVLGICGEQWKKVPVYVGAGSPLAGRTEQSSQDSTYDGEDGLAGYTSIESVKDEKEPDTAASLALLQFSEKYSGDLSILCLGPATNLALSQLLDPQFSSRLARVVLKSGSYKARGNSLRHPSSEHNLCSDPESVQVLMTEFPSGVLQFVPWEVCSEPNKTSTVQEGSEACSVEWSWAEDEWVGEQDSGDRGKLLKHIFEHQKTMQQQLCDPPLSTFRCDHLVTTAVALWPEWLVATERTIRAAVETSRCLTRGQLVLDWECMSPQWGSEIQLVTGVHVTAVREALWTMTKK